MEHYQRFQILSASRQDLFLPDSPVWVSRCQLSLDLESGKRLLQVRMVNCSERTLRQVFLRVVCLGANRERLAQLELVPMQSLSVLPGRAFGDDKPVEIPVKGTVFTEAYAQRVRFADDSAWDETDPEGYLAFKAVPVLPSDPYAETLADRSFSGGVRNDCYFRSQHGLWVCSCGMPNAVRRLRCARCGADRLWLEKHMDVNLIDAPAPVKAPIPVKAPEPAPAPAPAPTPAFTVIPAPISSEPPVQPTILIQPAPEPEPEEARVSHAGRNAAIVFAVLLFLVLGAFCAWRYLMPYLRYREALRERAAGNYDKAVTLFEDLKLYRDSPEQITRTLSRKAAALMGEGKYAEAMEILETLEGSEDQIADCLYSLGVLAYNDKDFETALSYVEQLRARFPDYDKTETLAQYCWYSLGQRTEIDAGAMANTKLMIEQYRKAIEYFTQANGYEDSAERITACEYQIADAYRFGGELQAAIAAYEALGGYSDAPTRRQDCMFEYVQQHIDDYLQDSCASDYLTELAEAGYPGAQELLDRLNGEGFHFQVDLSESDGPDPETARDLSKVTISWSVERRDGDGAVLVLVRYRLPDGAVGRSLLNMDRSASGVKSWTEIPFPTNCFVSGMVTLDFYDAARGETEDALLDTISFRYSFRAGEEDRDPADSDDGAPRYGEDTDPTGESSPGTGGG